MGNITGAPKFDIVSILPVELVLEIVSYLSLQEVARCTLVSRKWNQVIANLTPVWCCAASRTVGLSKTTFSTSVESFTSPKQFLVMAMRHTDGVKNIRLIPTHVYHSIPNEVQFTQCLEAKQTSVIHIRKLNQTDITQPRFELVVNKLTNTNKSQGQVVSQNIATLPIANRSRIVWAHVSDKDLYWVSTSGVWCRYDLSAKKTLVTMKTPLLKEGRGVTVAKCKTCSMVVASHWFSTTQDNHSAYAVQVQNISMDDRLTQGSLVQWKVVQKTHTHELFVNHDSRYWLREGFVVSNKLTKTHGVCHSHTLVLQADSCTMVQTLETFANPEDNKSVKVEFGKPYCINCDHHLLPKKDIPNGVCSISSEVTLSSDETLLGQVLANRLHVWQLKNLKEKDSLLESLDLKLMSNSVIFQNQTGVCNSVRLVALGHVLSIIAYTDTSYLMVYTLKIVQTHTGVVLSEFRRIEKFYDWSFCCQIDPFHKFYFMCGDDQWLNDIQSRVPESLVTTIHNHYGKIHIETLQLKETAIQSWRKHWRCAINYGLRE